MNSTGIVFGAGLFVNLLIGFCLSISIVVGIRFFR
jgi:hypothetical protein